VTAIRRRPRLVILAGLFLYLFVAFRVSDVLSVEVEAAGAACPARLLAADSASPGGSRTVTILQGNAWMLPVRPFLLPYAFSTDRPERLGRLVSLIRACRPDVVMLQEVFERPMVEVLARSLPGYRVLTSGESDLTGTLNASGLVTLTRLPVEAVRFREFPPLPDGAKAVERMGRKGLLAVDVGVPGFPGTLVNLHLYASRDEREGRVTRHQLARVLDFAREVRARGRRVLIAGDFNLEPAEVAGLLPGDWALSSHGATYDPPGNRYTVEGSNNTAGNHEERRLGAGVKTVDHLVNATPGDAVVTSEVLDRLLLSDHYFLQHRLVLGEG